MKRITRIRIDLAAINISYFLNFSAYYSMQGLQSSLNKSIGTQALCALFISVTISAMFIPPILISAIGERRSMSLGTATYSLFTLANCYPRPYTLIPAAIIMGCGVSASWASLRGYLRAKSLEYSLIDGTDKDAKTTHVFGIFMAFLSASLLVGNIISSLTFQSISSEGEENFIPTNISVQATTSVQRNVTMTNGTKQITKLYCGIHNCDYDPQNQTETPLNTEQVIINSPVPFILFGVFASMQAAAALIQLLAPRELRPTNVAKQTNDNTPMISKARKPTGKQTLMKRLMATIKLNITNKTARLLILITLDIGIMEGFIMGQLTRDWITCYMGIEYVGYGICVLGIGSIVSSYGCGILSYRVRVKTMLLAVLVLELASGIGLLLWKPNMTTDTWIFYVTFGVYGVIYTSRKTLINASYTIFFPNNIEAANSSTTMWGATGAAVAYAISSVICNRDYIIITLVIALIGTGMFELAERTRDKSHQGNPEEIEVIERERD